MTDDITVIVTSPTQIIAEYNADESAAYFERMILLFRNSIIGYWRMNDTSGTAVVDVAGSSRNAIYNGTTLAAGEALTGLPVPLFSTGHITANDNAQLTSQFNGHEGAVMGWAKIAGAWNDGSQRFITYLYADNNNQVQIYKTTDNGFFISYYSGGVIYTTWFPMFLSGWFHWAVSWSETHNRVTFYINGVPGNQKVLTSTWSGSLTNLCTFGGAWGGFLWNGYIADVLLLNREITFSEAKQAGYVDQPALRMTVLGDSITVREGMYNAYPFQVMASLRGSNAGVHDVAVGGSSIRADLANQVALCLYDDADIVIIALGTGDWNGGDMESLKTILRTQISILQAANSNAAFYYLNVLPRWTDITGSTPTDMSNTRAAISIVCSEKGVTCWDTFTDPWITATDTVDGLHPSYAGHTKIATRVLARLSKYV